MRQLLRRAAAERLAGGTLRHLQHGIAVLVARARDEPVDGQQKDPAGRRNVQVQFTVLARSTGNALWCNPSLLAVGHLAAGRHWAAGSSWSHRQLLRRGRSAVRLRVRH
jgi:hypothetical protein